MRKNVSIIGGGSSAHTIIPLLSKTGYSISLLTSRPERWRKKIRLEHQSETGEIKEIFDGDLNIASNDPKTILANADFIILCIPVSQYKIALNRIAPFIDKEKKVYLGTIYGQGGFNWIVNEIKAKYSLNRAVTFASGLLPWICRTKKYGEIGITYGPKARNVAAVYPLEEFDVLKDTFLNDICCKWFHTGEFYQAKNFISLTLSVDNQIIHPSRMYGLYLKNPERWNKKEDVPFFYRDFDDISAGILKKVDNDYSKIREKIKKDNPDVDYKYMLDYLSLERFSYDSCNENIKTSFTSSKTLRLIETPVVKNRDNKWELNKNHRFFTDDIFYGLCIAKWFSEQFSLNVPMIDEILEWAQKILEVSLIKSMKLNVDCTLNGVEVGTPEKYKISLSDSLM
ncbi:MAG: NAD/NADP octopine/nopaline dehydrogenase family protein [Bacteroidales bacterium]|nr:NAD/NADP octopine/nopaline dehydrogenase family protein [Bacteroidota bacterium]MBL6949954.1 NAD/NADP octopine/nopaline dehydrogenase family protein [Bacteroidales bacterium]